VDSEDGRGATADERAAIRARFVAVLDARRARLIDESARPATAPSVAGENETSTVGTGSVLAIGCSAVALVVLLIAVLVLLLTRWL
jgi:hypothetical protein